MPSPRQPECVVTGTLALMLRMSQVVGVAPLSFKKTRRGWKISVSSLSNIYGKVLSFILWGLSTTTIALDIIIEPERSYRTRTNSTRIVWVADVGTVGLVVCTAAFTGMQRMKCLTVYLAKLHEINLKLSLYREESSNEGTRRLIAISSIIMTVVTIALDYSIFMYQVINEDGKVITSGMYIFYNMSTIVLQVILVTFSQVAISVLTSLQTLNNCLKDLLQEVTDDASESKQGTMQRQRKIYGNTSYSSINTVIDTMAMFGGKTKTTKSYPDTIRRLSILYCSLCDVVRQVNDSHGSVLVSLMLSLLLHLVITPYHVITNIFNRSRSDRSSPLLQLNWATLHFSNLLLIVEPCHRTHDEMELTKHLISQMLLYTPAENYSQMSELRMFYRHLILNEVRYSPMKMLSLDRAIIVSILGSITTYLVVIVQL